MSRAKRVRLTLMGQPGRPRKSRVVREKSGIKRDPEKKSAPPPNKKKDGIPGVDFSGVHPETGRYVVVRGNYKGVKEKKSHQPSAQRQKPQPFWIDAEGHRHSGLNPHAPKTPDERKRKDSPICGAKRTGKSASGEGICCQTAGWGTDHPGYGHCRHHGGNTPAHRKRAEKEKAIEVRDLYGLPKNIDPHTALLEEVQRTAGHVEWLNELIKDLDSPDKLKQITDMGVHPSVWIEMYQEERKHLKSVSEAAIRAGVARLQVEIELEKAKLMAAVIKAILHDPKLSLTNQQLALAPTVVRQHLQLLSQSQEEGVLDAIDVDTG